MRIRTLQTAAVLGVATGGRAVAQLLPLAAALIFVSPRLSLGGAALLVPFSLALSRVRRRASAAAERAQQLSAELHAGTDDLIYNLDLWRTHGAGARVEAALAAAGRRATRAQMSAETGRALLSGANEVLGALAVLGAVATASALGLPLDGRLVAFAAVFFMAYRPLRDLGDATVWCARGAAAREALERALSNVEVDAEPRRSCEIMASLGETAAQHLIVREFGALGRGPRTTLALAPGEIVCVMGPTGSGKTTLLRALLGLEASSGVLTYGGRDLCAAGVGPGARPFAWVPQDAPLVTAPLLDNVALFGGDRRAAREALVTVGASSVLESVGDRNIGPGGVPLSGGERRLVSLARAMCGMLPVLLLDEPTEGLDADAQARVLDAIRRLRGSRSVILVTHRPEVAAIADRVVPLGNPSPGTPRVAA